MLSISSKSLKTLCLSLSAQASPNSTNSRCGWVPVGLFHNTRESNINDGKLHGEHGGRQSEADGGRRHPLGDLIRYGPEREREKVRDDRVRERDRLRKWQITTQTQINQSYIKWFTVWTDELFIQCWYLDLFVLPLFWLERLAVKDYKSVQQISLGAKKTNCPYLARP